MGSRIESTESASTLMTHRSGSSNGSIQAASPEIPAVASSRDSIMPSRSGRRAREGSDHSAGSSMNGHKM